jgi:hypothetical protein
MVLDNTEPNDEELWGAAYRLYNEEGAIEIADPINVSRNDEGEGAYVAAWVWVPFDEVFSKFEQEVKEAYKKRGEICGV